MKQVLRAGSEKARPTPGSDRQQEALGETCTIRQESVRDQTHRIKQRMLNAWHDPECRPKNANQPTNHGTMLKLPPKIRPDLGRMHNNPHADATDVCYTSQRVASLASMATHMHVHWHRTGVYALSQPLFYPKHLPLPM